MNNKEQQVGAGRRLYYSSSQGPFYNANNIFMFYGGGGRGETVEGVLKAVRGGEHMIHVHGEQGSGKTMLSLVISDRLKHKVHTMRYDLPQISAAKVLRHLLIELVPQHSSLISAHHARNGADGHAIEKAVACIENQLERVSRPTSFKPYVLFVDSEAAMDPVTIKVLERLSSFWVNNAPVLHCVVFHTTASSAERYAAMSDNPAYQSPNHFWLRRLNLAEISEYLGHHMMLFDFNRRDLFSREMAYFIADRSGGVFKSVNLLARNAFTIANLEEADRVSMSHLLMAGLPELDDQGATAPFFSRHRGAAISVFTLCGLAVIASVLVTLA